MPCLQTKMSRPESPAVVIALSVHDIKVSPRSAADGLVPAVTNTTVKISGVEPLKIQIHLEKVLCISYYKFDLCQVHHCGNISSYYTGYSHLEQCSL